MTYITIEAICSSNQFNREQKLQNTMQNPMSLISMQSLPEKINIINKQYKAVELKDINNFITDAVQDFKNSIGDIESQLKNLSAIGFNTQIDAVEKNTKARTILNDILAKINNANNTIVPKLFSRFCTSSMSKNSLFSKNITDLCQIISQSRYKIVSNTNFMLSLGVLNPNYSLDGRIKQFSSFLSNYVKYVANNLEGIERATVEIDKQYSDLKLIEIEQIKKRILDNTSNEISEFYRQNTFESLMNIERQANFKNNLAAAIGSRI